jgi:hypothetical protein
VSGGRDRPLVPHLVPPIPGSHLKGWDVRRRHGGSNLGQRHLRGLWWVLNDTVATQGHDHPARSVLASASRPRPAPGVRRIHESDGAPDEKESRPKHEPPGYQACMMRDEMWPRRQETFSPPDASPPRCAQLMGLASRGSLVLVLGATAERQCDPHFRGTPTTARSTTGTTDCGVSAGS